MASMPRDPVDVLIDQPIDRHHIGPEDPHRDPRAAIATASGRAIQ